MPLPNGQRIYATSADGSSRRRLPASQITAAECRISRWGGYDSFTIDCVISPTGDALTSIQPGDRVEFFYKGVRRYRGWIEERTRNEDEPDRLMFSGFGLSFLMGQQLCFGRYAYAGDGVDIGAAFAEITRDATINRNQTLLSAVGRRGMPLYNALQILQIGTTTTFVDAYNKLFKDVANDLVQNQAGNLATWGGDVDDFGQDRLFCRPLAPTTFPPTHSVIVPARQTQTAMGELQTGDLKNRLLATGGQPRFAQMLHNGGFDYPLVSQAGDSGLIADGDFESQTWTLGGGASYKDGGHQEGQPFSGNTMVETDHVGESADKSGTFGVAPIAGHTYVFSVRAKKEVGLQTADGSGYLHLLDAGGSLLLAVPLTLAPAGTAWDYFSAAFAMPAGAHSYAVHFQCDHISAYNGDQGGLLIDAVSLEDASVVYQDAFTTTEGSGASVNAVNWVYKDCAFDGLYSVYLNVTSSDADGHDIHLQALGASNINLGGFKQTLRFGARFRSPVVQTAGLGIPKITVQLLWYRSDNSFVSKDITTVDAQAATSVWQYAEIVAGAPSDATQVRPIVTFRSSGELIIDCLSLMDAQALTEGDVPVMPDGHPGFTPEGGLSTFLTAAASGLGGDYATAETTYGSRVDIVGADGVTSLAGLTQTAKGRLRNTAIPLRRPSVTRMEDAALYWPGDSVSLQGAHGARLSGGQILTIVAVRMTFGDLFLVTLEMDREAPDETLIEKQLILDQLRALGPGAASASGASGGYSNQTNMGGGTTGAGTAAYRTTLQASETDPTLHDDFRAGPHVSDGEHSDIAATKTEVVAGRTRTTLALSYTTLKGRLDAMEADLAAALARPLNPSWGLRGVDSSAGGTSAFGPGDITPAWSSLYAAPGGDLSFGTSGGVSDPIAWEQKVILSTRLKVAADTTVSITVTADNAARVFLGGSQVGADCNLLTGACTYALALTAGWNLLQVCYQNGDEDSYQLSVAGVGGALATLVDRMAPG